MTEPIAHDLDRIVGLLAKNYQRATYGAVAELVGANPRKMMGERPKDARNSWIVAEKDGRPTGYKPEQVDPALVVRQDILNSGDTLREWLLTAK